jgi:ABC-type branched-subunit amino acid transport system permease subunit
MSADSGQRPGRLAARLRGPRVVVWALAVVFLVAYPSFASAFAVIVLSIALIFGLMAISLDIQWGYAGLINFGAAAWFGLGAYAYALLTIDVPAFGSALLSLPAAMALGAALALLIGYPAFRARTLPLYYALLTLATALLLERYATIATGLTGGSNGIPAVPALNFSLGPLAWEAVTPFDNYVVVVVFVGVAYALAHRFVSSPFGRAVRAIREDELRCETLGYPVLRYKLAAASAGGALAALAGALYAAVNGTVDPGLLGVALSIQAFVWVAIGGQGTLWGPLVAAVGLQLAENWLSGLTTDLYLIILAVVFIVAVIVLPQGLAGAVRQLLPRLGSPAPARVARR